MKVAALFVEPQGVYASFPDVDLWPAERDARRYSGTLPVVAHPPCERWGRYWSGGPSAKVRRILGDDDGCFASALASVRCYGGVLEHPEASHAFHQFLLGRPRPGSWQPSRTNTGWITQVAQSAYGHRARKLTWLFYVGREKPADLDWSVPRGERLDEGFHSKEERLAKRAQGQKPRPRLSRIENLSTPRPFAEMLLALAQNSGL